MNTFNSKLPCELAKPTAVSLPITCTATIVNISHCVGLTLPGIIDEPGSFSGIEISAKPALGPEANHLTSFAIFIKSL